MTVENILNKKNYFHFESKTTFRYFQNANSCWRVGKIHFLIFPKSRKQEFYLTIGIYFILVRFEDAQSIKNYLHKRVYFFGYFDVNEFIEDEQLRDAKRTH